ncbi:hypothetical protein ACIQ9K_37200 [Streptomyces microflavus]|uniref:hypothetical protein n=1 Tax=Streptomyces microflavus TaxID=1919 RepID=UPI0038292611
MTHRISALISVFGVFVSVTLFVVAVGQYRSGASVLWPVFGAVLFLCALYTLVRDARQLLTEPAA